MAETLPDGSYQNYTGICDICNAEIPTNIQGDEIGEHICSAQITKVRYKYDVFDGEHFIKFIWGRIRAIKMANRKAQFRSIALPSELYDDCLKYHQLNLNLNEITYQIFTPDTLSIYTIKTRSNVFVPKGTFNIYWQYGKTN